MSTPLLATRVAALSLCLVAGAHIAQAAVPHTQRLSLDGIDDIVTIGNRASVSLPSQVTVEAWIKPRTIATTNNQDRVVSKGTNYELTISTGDTGCAGGTRGSVQWRATVGGVDARICGGQLTPGTWHHVAGTYDGVTFALYVDGARVASLARSGALSVNSTALAFGNRPALDRAFDGELDEVRIWRRALTQSELQIGSGNLLTGSEADLAGYYRLDETAGQTVSDLTSNANHGVLGATTAVEASDPARAQDFANTAPVVNAGADQVIQLPTNTVQLFGSAQDDGLPSGTLNPQWITVSGPAAVSFANAAAFQTMATFSAAGTYVLRLDVSDGALSGSDLMEVRVTTSQSISSIEIHPRFVTLGPGETQQFWIVAYDGAGNPVNATPSWTATSGAISSQGVYTPSTQTGLHTVRATIGGISRIASVDVKSSTVWPSTAWTTATPSSMGLNETYLAQARDYALIGAGSGMITRSGRVVLSWGSTTQRYDVKSTTKSLGGTALGLALQDGMVALNDAGQLHLPSLGIPPSSNASTGWLDDITLSHLATHTAGFDKAGGYTALLFEPGTRWSYTDGGANWLADALTNLYSLDLNTLLFSRVFTPLGISTNELRWRSNAYREDTLNGIKRREFGAGISLSVNAMARVGYLYLRRGQWQGQRILPDTFIEQVQQPVAAVRGVPVQDPARFPQASNHYGLLWWTNADSTLPEVPRDAYWAWGLGDSLIVVIPSLDIVATRGGNAWRSGWSAEYEFVDDFITPIVRAVNAKISVPQVVGQEQASAIAAIDEAGLAVSSLTQQRSSTIAAGRIVEQTPAGGSQVARNTGVRLVVSSGP